MSLLLPSSNGYRKTQFLKGRSQMVPAKLLVGIWLPYWIALLAFYYMIIWSYLVPNQTIGQSCAVLSTLMGIAFQSLWLKAVFSILLSKTPPHNSMLCNWTMLPTYLRQVQLCLYSIALESLRNKGKDASCWAAMMLWSRNFPTVQGECVFSNCQGVQGECVSKL